MASLCTLRSGAPDRFLAQLGLAVCPQAHSLVSLSLISNWGTGLCNLWGYCRLNEIIL